MSNWFKSLFAILGVLFTGVVTGLIFALAFVPSSSLGLGLGLFALPLAAAAALGTWRIIAAAVGAFKFTRKAITTGSLMQAGEALDRIAVPPGRIVVLLMPVGACFFFGLMFAALSTKPLLLVTGLFTVVGVLYGSLLYWIACRGLFDELLWPKDGFPE